MSIHIKVKIETINWCLYISKIEELKNIELIALTDYDDKYIKTEIKTYDDKVYTNFRGLKVP